MCRGRVRFSVKELGALMKAMQDEEQTVHNAIRDTILANAHAVLRRDEAFRKMHKLQSQSNQQSREGVTEDMVASLIRSMGYGRSDK